ncbi:MAG TPA: hypothetical protein VGQ91_02320 [Ideonella sp.]|jgi:hypothetical protein|nr:hypothetical protein [Ideonella sp.]
MRHFFQDKARHPAQGPSWSPLLVLGLSVMASVVLISACMAMMSPEAEAASPKHGGALALAPGHR